MTKQKGKETGKETAKKKKTISAQLNLDTIEKFEYVMNHFKTQNLTAVNKSDTLRILIEQAYKEIKEQERK